MSFWDIIFSFEGKLSRRKYIFFFLIFTVIFSSTLFFELFLGGIIYLSVIDKLLGNYHFLFYPCFLLFLFNFIVLCLLFIVYLGYSVKRARDFSRTPIKYLIYYTSTIIFVGLIAIISQLKYIEIFFVFLYFIAFLPFLFFKSSK